MRTKAFSLLAAAALFSTGAFAQDGGFKLKHRSAFSGTQVARDPFWPIGWKKEVKGDSVASADAEITADEFSVSSILLSPPALAVINGREYGEGQFIPIPGSGAKAQIAAIGDGKVQIAYHGKIVTATLRRNEHLNAPKPFDPADGSPAQASVTPR